MVKAKGVEGFEPKGVKLSVEPNRDKSLDPERLSQIADSREMKSIEKYNKVVLYSEIEPVKPTRDIKSLSKAIDECEDLLNAIQNMVIGFNVDLDTLSKYD